MAILIGNLDGFAHLQLYTIWHMPCVKFRAIPSQV
jgi:hypothetical protein